MSSKLILLAFILFPISQLCFADGEKTYKEVCSVCHTAGVANAPKLGDQNAWKKLIGEGQVIITAHGYVGVRAMPPKGGNPNLTVEAFSDALVYIVNNSGGKWTSPDAKTVAAINKEIEERKAGLNKKQ